MAALSPAGRAKHLCHNVTEEREQILERQAEGYAAAKAAGRKGARGNGAAVHHIEIVSALVARQSIRTIAKDFNVSTSTVQRIKTEQESRPLPPCLPIHLP